MYIVIFLFLFLFEVFSLPQLSLDKNLQKAYFYSNDRKIQYFTSVLTHSKHFSKITCKNDQSYSYVKIQKPKSKYLGIIVCNIHARQLITAQICLRLMQMFKKSHPQITNKMNFKIFYRANKMREVALSNQGNCIRVNENNIDLNRNFPTQFNFYNVSKTSQIYPGQKPINQNFTICLNKTLQQKIPDLFLDIHSGQCAFYYQQGINNQKQLSILKNLNQSFSQINLTKITTLKKDNQSINGHIFADLKVRKKVGLSFLFEIYDGRKGLKKQEQTDNYEDNCFYSFNPGNYQQMVKNRNIWADLIINTIHQSIKFLDSTKK